MKNILIFAAGVVVGAGIALYASKDYFEEHERQEIESVKAAYRKKYEPETESKDEKTAKTPEKLDNEAIRDKSSYSPEDLKKYRDIVKTNYGVAIDEAPSAPKNEPAPPEDEPEEPFVISYEDMGKTGNVQVTLTYYAINNILSTEANEEVDIHEYIGDNTLQHMGEEELGCMYVRNNKRGEDYTVIEDRVTEIV